MESKFFKVSRGKMLATLYTINGLIPTLVLFAITVVFIIIGVWTSDIRWELLALMSIFLVTPMVMAFLYFYYGLRELTACNALRHRLILNGATLTIDINDRIEEKKKEKKKEDISENPKSEETSSENSDAFEVVRSLEVPVAEIQALKVGMSRVSLPVGERGVKGIISVPQDAFDTPQEFQAFIQGIIDAMRKSA